MRLVIKNVQISDVLTWSAVIQRFAFKADENCIKVKLVLSQAQDTVRSYELIGQLL